MAENEVAGELFELLTQKDQTNQIRIGEIFRQNPQVLTDEVFIGRINSAEHRTQTASLILNNLKNMENDGLLAHVEKPAETLAASLKESLKVETGDKPQEASAPTLQVETSGTPRQSYTVEDLRLRQYQGLSLTVEDLSRLKEDDRKKKTADLKNNDGDKKRHKREPSKDKFKDEDVIKYMYEEWFLGGASWLFNKTSDAVLNLIDTSCDIYLERCAHMRREKEKIKDSKLNAAREKVASFGSMTSQTLKNLDQEGQDKISSFKDILNDLQENLGNPNPKWRHYDANDPFIKKLEAMPDHGKSFIEYCGPEIENRTKTIVTTGKLAMMAASMAMIDKVMRNDDSWRGKDKAYKSDEELNKELKQGTLERHMKILQAINILSEDTRLIAEIKYDKLADPKPDFARFTQQEISSEVNGFLKNLTEQIKSAQEAQSKEIAENRFNAASGMIGGGPKQDVAVKLGQADKLIDDAIKKGSIYQENLFDRDHLQERLKIKTDLFTAAVEESSPTSYESTLNKLRGLNEYNQEVLNARKSDMNERRAYLERVKSRLQKRDGKDIFSARHGTERTN